MAQVYVVGRTAGGRVGTQHMVPHVGATDTDCGRDLSGWSRFYVATRIEVLLCGNCQRTKAGKKIMTNSRGGLALVRPA